MPTVEERLAALEARMAALTETTPTTYYEHQYSGEEIDNAVSRALPNGAIDQSVGTFVRPNLLDNWYFGNPVDQRKGYIQIGGTMMYKDAACTDQFGPSSGTTPVVVYATYARPIDHGVELALYIPLTSIVRGYTGNGYTVDRWITDGKPVTIGSGIGVEAVSFLYQKIEQSTMDALHGKLITFSALTTSNGFLTGSWVVDNANQSDTRIAENDEFILFRSPWTGNGWGIYSKTAMHILAAKLELGPTQTLAHQDAAGNWVLNEVPKYGEQLRRCQRYQFDVFDRTSAGQGYLAQVKAIDSTQAYGVLSTPVTMREGGIPALVTDCSAANPYGAFGIYSMGYSGGIGVITGLSLFSRVQNGVILRAVGSNFVAGNDYQIWVDNQSAHQFLLNLNL